MSEQHAAGMVERANRVYWETSTGVNSIAEDLDVSKSALYEMIEPLESGRGCPNCGSMLVYENRTARERGRLSCPTCDGTFNETEVPDVPPWAGEVGEGEAAGTEEGHPRGDAGAVTGGAAGGAQGAPQTPAPGGDHPMPAGAEAGFGPVDPRLLGGAALMGLGAGFIAAVLLLRRR